MKLILSIAAIFLSATVFASQTIECHGQNNEKLILKISFDPGGRSSKGKILEFSGNLSITPELGLFYQINLSDSVVTTGALELKMARLIANPMSIQGIAQISIRGNHELTTANGSIVYSEEKTEAGAVSLSDSYVDNLVCR